MSLKADSREPEKNLHECRVHKREFEEMLAFGKRHAKARGLKPGDVADAVAAVRAKPKERGR